MVNKITLENPDEDISTIRKRLILNKIQEQIHGINISKIAEALNMHRNTVSNYVDELENEKKITVQKIGQSNICFMISKDISSNNYQSTIFSLYRYFFESFEEVMASYTDNTKDVLKQIGKSMNKRLKLPELDPIDLTKNKKEVLDEIADNGLSLLKIFNSIVRVPKYRYFAKAKKVNYIEGDEEMAISLKIEFAPVDYLHFESFYHVIAGSIEGVLQDNYGETMNFDVHLIPPEKFVCYYKISMK